MKNKVISKLSFIMLLSFILPAGFSYAAEFDQTIEANSIDPGEHARYAMRELQSDKVCRIEPSIDRVVLQDEIQQELAQIKGYSKPTAMPAVRSTPTGTLAGPHDD